MPLVALVAAWLVPGAGHVYLGRLWRGVVIFVTVSGLFWGGVAIGGVMTVDYETEQWWFVADMFAGVHGFAAWLRSRKVMANCAEATGAGAARPRDRAVSALRQQSIDKYLSEKNLALVAPTETVARTYAGVAGLLNLMCVFDAVVLSLMGLRGEAEVREETEAPS